MAEYMNKETFLASMGLRGDETKYGNRDGEHQHRSYSTYMSYEIMDCVDDSIEEDVAPVVHGRWEPILDGVWNLPTPVLSGWRCSECGRTEQEKEPYCHCGAKMDLEEK